MDQLRSPIPAFLVALAATAIAAAVQGFALVPWNYDAPFVTFTFAVILAAWLGGVASGLAATVLGAAAGTRFFMNSQELSTVPLGLPVRLVAFVAIAVLTSVGFESLHRARQRLLDRQRELEERQKQLEHEVAERRKAESAEREQREQLATEMHRRAVAEVALREREERIRMAVDSADIGTWDFNVVTGERNWSDRTRVMFGVAPDADVTNMSYLDRVHPDDQERVSQAVQKALDPSGDGRYEIECRLLLPDSRVGWFVVKGQAFFESENSERRATRFIGTVMEITERKKAEQALRQAEERFRTMAKQAPVGIFHADEQGLGLFVNDTWCALTGATAEEAIGHGWGRFLHPDDRQRVVEEWQDAALHRRNYVTEVRFLNPDTGTRWVAASAVALVDDSGKVTGYIGTIVDLTDRKAVEDAIRGEQELLRHTLEVQEHERQLIAYEIHDGLIQHATGALMQLESMQSDDIPEHAADKLQRLVHTLRMAVAEGRRLIDGIRPPVLDDFGVVAALEHLIREEERAHVQVEFVKDDEMRRMDPKLEEAIYRITQEALTNIYKHSQSKRVRVELGRRGDDVHLEVRDWGVGFVASNGSKETHGLRGMSERARIAGGMCRIESAPGDGTRVVVELPYRPKCDAASS